MLGTNICCRELKTQSEVDFTVFFCCCENTHCYSAANKMWKYDVRDVLVAWRAPPLAKWARSGRFLNTHTHTQTHARTYTRARARILWTATCGFLLDSRTQPVGVSDHQWDHFSCYGVALWQCATFGSLSFWRANMPAYVKWLLSEGLLFIYWWTSYQVVPFDRRTGALRIKFHMVHFILKQHSARRESEMKAGPTLVCAFLFRKYFKWLDSRVFPRFWSAAAKDKECTRTDLSLRTFLRLDRRLKLQARDTWDSGEHSGTTPWPAAGLPWSDCGGAFITACSWSRGVIIHWVETTKCTRVSSTGGCGRTRRGRCRRRSCPSSGCRTDRDHICRTESTTPLRFSCWTYTTPYLARRKAQWTASWTDIRPCGRPRVLLWPLTKKLPF